MVRELAHVLLRPIRHSHSRCNPTDQNANAQTNATILGIAVTAMPNERAPAPLGYPTRKVVRPRQNNRTDPATNGSAVRPRSTSASCARTM